jgi:hypothetical protein
MASTDRQALVAASIFLLAAAALATRTARQTVGDPYVSGNGTNDPRDLEPTSPALATP